MNTITFTPERIAILTGAANNWDDITLTVRPEHVEVHFGNYCVADIDYVVEFVSDYDEDFARLLDENYYEVGRSAARWDRDAADTFATPATPEPVLTRTIDCVRGRGTAIYKIAFGARTDRFEVYGEHGDYVLDSARLGTQTFTTFEQAVAAADDLAADRVAAFRPFDFPEVGDVLVSGRGDLFTVEHVTSSDGETADRFTALCRTADRTTATDWTADEWFSTSSDSAWLRPTS